MIKKHFKKLVSLALAAVMVMGMSATAFAAGSDANTYTTDTGITVDQSIQQSVVDNLPESTKLELQNDDGTLVFASTTYYDLETGSTSRAVMPTSDFKLTVTATRLSSSQMAADGVYGDAFKFVATGEWLVNPLYEFTDCIGISWSDDFTLYDDYGYTYTKDYNGLPFFNFDALTRNDVSAEEGVAHDVDLLLFDRQDEVTLVAKVYKANSSGSANVCASYGHVIITASSVDVSFSKGKEISMSVGFASGIKKASPEYESFDY